jgi:hypothetical protein
MEGFVAIDPVLALVVCAVALVVGFIGVLTFPRYALQPLVIGRVWHLLDDVDRACRHGVLPETDPAVIQLRQQVHLTAKVSDRIKMIDILVSWRLAKRYPRAFESPEWSASTANLSAPERMAYHEFERRLHLLLPLVVFIGTWIGIVSLLIVAFSFTFDVVVRRRRNTEPSEEVLSVSVASIKRSTAVMGGDYDSGLAMSA